MSVAHSIAQTAPQVNQKLCSAPTWYETMCARTAERAEQQRRAAEMVKCSRCGRTMTDATSIRLGIGPECRKIGGAK